MEIWTASHISTVDRLNTLKHSINSGELVSSNQALIIKHRVSISYSKDMEDLVLEFISASDCIVYDRGVSKMSQFQHLQYILSQVKQEDANTMICFLDDDDLLLSFPQDSDSYDVIVGWQMIPIDHAPPLMRKLAEHNGAECPRELMLNLQSDLPVPGIKFMQENKLILTYNAEDFSGYSARLGIIREVLENVAKKSRFGLLINMVDLDIMNALDQYENRLNDREHPFIYHRLMKSKDWIDLSLTFE